MADPRAQPEHEEDIDGASPRERLVDAARYNNTDLLQEIIDECADAEAAATLLNSAKTVMGNYIYHEAASRGNAEVIDLLLDQEGFECDPISARDGNTPLHSAVDWVNRQGPSSWEEGLALIQMMVEAGTDPRIRNKASLTPAELADPSNVELRKYLEGACKEFENEVRKDEVFLDFADDLGDAGDDDAGSVGSASDSDFDQEEYKRVREEEKKKKDGVA
ncbi:hypothetical protein CJF32_00006412 [Rutstroemia sp. NJR-2017a WRK4]|nr:hypothetical protein CJF32_00006412 [Rutstroemia sp. NJR-2017a WRK4]